MDAAIRADLRERSRESDPDQMARSLVAYAAALRAVLDEAARLKGVSYYDSLGDGIRRVVARELGVTQ